MKIRIPGNKARIFAGLFFGLASLVSLLAYAVWADADRPAQIDQQALYQVTYVVDGDTFKADIAGQIITVRLLGINTPETVDPRRPVECFGPEASAAAKELLSGRRTSLKLNPDREIRDKYGRYLAYAYRDDGLFVNESLIKDGFAREYTYGTPYMFQKRFRAAEKAAKKSGKGLWGACHNEKD